LLHRIACAEPMLFVCVISVKYLHQIRRKLCALVMMWLYF